MRRFRWLACAVGCAMLASCAAPMCQTCCPEPTPCVVKACDDCKPTCKPSSTYFTGECVTKLWHWASYQPLCSKDVGCCADADCYPPLYRYFQPCKYNVQYKPVDCPESKGWNWDLNLHWDWPLLSAFHASRPGACGTCCQPCEPVCPKPRTSVCEPPVAAKCEPKAKACDECKPKLALSLPKMATCTTCNVGSGGCPPGTCGKPKARLDQLPVLAPTMFRKCEPCGDTVPVAAVIEPVAR